MKKITKKHGERGKNTTKPTKQRMLHLLHAIKLSLDSIEEQALLIKKYFDFILTERANEIN